MNKLIVWLLTLMFWMGPFEGIVHGSKEGPSKTGKSGMYEVKEDWLRDTILRKVANESRRELGEFRAELLYPKDKVAMPKRPRSLAFIDPITFEPGGDVHGSIVFLDGHRSPIKRISFRVNLKPAKKVWILKRAVRRGQRFDLKDVKAIDSTGEKVPLGICDDPRRLIGTIARRNLSAGTVLRYDQWKPTPMIKKGQPIQILLETATMRLLANGVALEDGREGQRIKVVNVHSRRMIIAKVRDPGTVVVEFGVADSPKAAARVSGGDMR